MSAALATNSDDDDDQIPEGDAFLPMEAFRPANPNRIPLPFEKPIIELEQQLAKLEAQPNPSPNLKETIRNLRPVS